ncbi:hypothetical protein AHAS_Ahas02G0188200 [Arachis hypogaea]
MYKKGNSDQQEHGEEILLSQNAPQADEVARETMNLNQPPPQPCSTPNLSHAQRKKHHVVRPRLLLSRLHLHLDNLVYHQFK